MIKKIIFAANIVVAMVAGVDFVMWCLSLPDTALLWHDGITAGYFQIVLLTLVIMFFILVPSLFFLDDIFEFGTPKKRK